MTVNCTHICGDVVTYDMVTTDTVRDIKFKVQDKDGVSVKCVKINYGDTEVMDDQKLEEVKILAHSNTVDIVAKERMTINTKWFDGVNVPNEVVTTDTILNLKNRLA